MNGFTTSKKGAIASLYAIAFVVAFFVSYSASIAEAVAPEKTAVVPPVVNETAESSTLATDPKSGYTTDFVGSPTDKAVGDFVVGPGKEEITIAPGTSKTVEIIVTNRTGELRQFNFVVEDATGSNDPATPVVLLGNDRGPYTLKDYISVPHAHIDLKHNERARIPVTISVPVDAEPGGRYGSILVTTVSKNAIKGDDSGTAPSSAIVSRIGMIFFLTIPGKTNIDGEFKSIKTLPQKTFFAKGPINFQLLFENKGDLHLNPYGEIRIKNMLDQEVGAIELDPWFALPKSLRSREVSWDRELLMGKYTATAEIHRGYGDTVDTQVVTFWVIPWKLVALVFGALFVLFFMLRFIAKNFEFKRKSS